MENNNTIQTRADVTDDENPIDLQQGCTDTSACNYWYGADIDDGSCYFAEDVTCSTYQADNYDGIGTSQATSVAGCEGECLYHAGCTIQDAVNYDAASNWAKLNIDASYAADDLCIFEEQEIEIVYGCMNENADNYDPTAQQSILPSNCIFPDGYTELGNKDKKTDVEDDYTMYYILGGVALIGAYLIMRKK